MVRRRTRRIKSVCEDRRFDSDWRHLFWLCLPGPPMMLGSTQGGVLPLWLWTFHGVVPSGSTNHQIVSEVVIVREITGQRLRMGGLMGEGNRHYRSAPPRRFRGTRKKSGWEGFVPDATGRLCGLYGVVVPLAVKHGISSTPYAAMLNPRSRLIG